LWAEAAKWIAKFPEGIVTGLDKSGQPASVRQLVLPFDATSGAMKVSAPAALGLVPGPANLLCHYHDEKLWNIRSIQVKGRLEERDGAVYFVATGFKPPSMWQLMKNASRSTRRYLEKRKLQPPAVNFAAIAELRERASKIQNP
jgi:hypothetical protein